MKSVYVLAFDIEILEQINKFGYNIIEFEINTTYNTNNLGFELYVLHIKIYGTGFPLTYLFLENNG